MAKIVLSTAGSLGDLHPKIALALELRERGHDVIFNTWVGYEEKISQLGFTFCPLRPDVDGTDRELLREIMHPQKGPEKLIREIVLPHLKDSYEDLLSACDGADLLVSGEVIYVARSVVEKTGIKWTSTSLMPLTMFSSTDPNVYPQAEFLDLLRPLPAAFHRALFAAMRSGISHWFEPYRKFRRELGLNEDHDPIFYGKFSQLLHLAMFSRALASPQPDWHQPTIQTGFCFYDGQQDTGQVPVGLEGFFNAGDPPIVFTLGSAAVMDPRDFYSQSVKAAKLLGRRAVLLYGTENDPPSDLTDEIAAYPYAPFSRLFPYAACVVHPGGVGTTGQVLRAGVPHLIMPYSHDQPDNAARCRRNGVARVIKRDRYSAETASRELNELLTDRRYTDKARVLAEVVETEHGTQTACDAIESVLSK